jgi:hypothetical protein
MSSAAITAPLLRKRLLRSLHPFSTHELPRPHPSRPPRGAGRRRGCAEIGRRQLGEMLNVTHH